MEKLEMITQIYHGQHALEALEELENARVLIVTDAFLAGSGALDRVTERLKKCQVSVFDRVVPDPPLEMVAAGVDALRKSGANIVISLGGGSSMDTAKGICAVAASMDELSGQIEKTYAIPTTSGSGSEVTCAAILTDAKAGIKYPLLDAALRPQVAVLDPDLVASVPAKVTADTGMDVLAHALEAYAAVNANDFTDAWSEKAAGLVFENLTRAYQNGSDQQARRKLHHASCMAGMAFDTAGLGLVHGIAHVLGGKFHLSHGRLNAILLPEVIKFNAGLGNGRDTSNTQEITEKYQKMAKLLGLSADTPRSGVLSLCRAIERLMGILEMPKTLTQAGIDRKELNETKSELAALALEDATAQCNPRKAEVRDVERILTNLI